MKGAITEFLTVYVYKDILARKSTMKHGIITWKRNIHKYNNLYSSGIKKNAICCKWWPTVWIILTGYCTQLYSTTCRLSWDMKSRIVLLNGFNILRRTSLHASWVIIRKNDGATYAERLKIHNKLKTST